ncbi:MAG: 2,3-bisphosphoglycerate-independent phosphoglycerate mutase [Firmicutes bacterium]|nr:2,3-bisphosphoglycerate-independent phosphoglycerate mutase [Bacillota bacterium]
MNKFTVLTILDGFGIGKTDAGNAIAAASTPNLDAIIKKYPHTSIGASGLSVGLPDGQMGNSEVGHLNIGAGRIIYQDFTRITKSINDGDFFENPIITEAINHTVKNGSALHLMGLLSDGGVHSHISHLLAFIDMAKKKGVSALYVHCFLDGRDVPPKCAEKYIDMLEKHINEVGLGSIASIAGRYYAMDRDKRWERIKETYDVLTLTQESDIKTFVSAKEALADAYAKDESDEFVKPRAIFGGAAISDNDSVIMFNFRPDRAREITRTFCDSGFDEFSRKLTPKNLFYVCMTQYDASMPNVKIAFPPQHHTNTLGEYIAACGKKQIRIAETEKYAHVTFFFNGGVETPNENEDRVLIPSPKVATYDLQPEMSAIDVTKAVLKAVNSGSYDLIIVNFANPDMVGHTGVFDAAVKAVETVDACIGKIYSAVSEAEGNMLITADHGNADTMTDESGNVITAHSTNPTPAILITPDTSDIKLRQGGILADIAPTLLELMELGQPAEMTGSSLILRS